MKVYLVIFLGTLLALNSCGLNKDIMFREDKNAVVQSSDSIQMKPSKDYLISIDDKFSFSLYTNNGEKLVTGIAGESENGESKTPLEYIVRNDGTAELPILGAVKVEGFSVKQLEDTLEWKYENANGYVDPFVQVKLLNQRVIVFPGGGGDAKVITLQNNNTTLVEVIALAGGIPNRGRADRIKIMRLVDGKRVIYPLNLATIEGLKYADLIVQANDYIYIEPNEDVAKESFERAAPLISIISSTLIIVTFITTLK